MIRVGIIGCGNIAWKSDDPRDRFFKTHAKAYAEYSLVHLAACADPVISRAQGLADAYPGVRPYTDYKKMLAQEGLDIVSVCTTTAMHASILEHLLRHTTVRYIFAEKPMTATLKDTQRIAALARKRHVSITINYLRRLDQSIIATRALIALYKFGSFRGGRIVYYGGVRCNAIHFLDLLNFFGVRITKAVPFVRKKLPDNDFTGSFFLANGGAPILMHGIDTPAYNCLEVDLFFERGRVTIGDRGVDIYRAETSKSFPGFSELVLQRQFPSTIAVAMREGVRRVVEQYRRREVSYDFLTREIAMMRLITTLERR